MCDYYVLNISLAFVCDGPTSLYVVTFQCIVYLHSIGIMPAITYMQLYYILYMSLCVCTVTVVILSMLSVYTTPVLQHYETRVCYFGNNQSIMSFSIPGQVYLHA